MNKTITTTDGFTWHIIEARVAQILHQADYQVYQLHDDESESLLEDDHVFMIGYTYAIEEPTNDKVYTLCGKTAVSAFMNKEYDRCHDSIFWNRTSDIHFFNPTDSPKEVIRVLRYCDATCYVDKSDFLNIIAPLTDWAVVCAPHPLAWAKLHNETFAVFLYSDICFFSCAVQRLGADCALFLNCLS